MFPTYITDTWPTHVLHMWEYLYNTCVADTCITHMLYTCNTLTQYHTCITDVVQLTM